MCVYKDRDFPWWRWIWWQKSLYICSKSHSPSPYFIFQTSHVFRAESRRLPWVKANFLRIFPGKLRLDCHMSCVGNVWKRWETFVRCALAHSDRSGHGACLGEQSQSQCESLDWSGVGLVRMDDWTQCTPLRLLSDGYSELFRAFHPF